MVKVIDVPVRHRRGLMEKLVFKGLVFNMSWEDPEMDRQSLCIEPTDTVLSISSAGCSPLNLLLQRPAKLFSIDSNPTQNALLELKLVAIGELPHDVFFDIFAARRPGSSYTIYQDHLRRHLSDRSRRYWDSHIHVLEKNLYRYGRMGIACRIVRGLLPLLGFSQSELEELFEITSLEEQQRWYRERVAPRLWRPVIKRLIKSRWFMYLCGVHPHQFGLVHHEYDMYDFVHERIEHVLTQVPIYDNYFLSMTVTGRFRGDRVPPYLREENYAALRDSIGRVQIVQGWLGPFLDMQPAGSIHKFNLMDIFDWMRPDAVEDAFRRIIRAASDDARAIYRSGRYRYDPPASLDEHYRRHDALASRLLHQDRSATYGSFYVLTLNPSDEPSFVLDGRQQREEQAVAVVA